MKCFYCNATIPDNSFECSECGALQENKVIPPAKLTKEDIALEKRDRFKRKVSDFFDTLDDKITHFIAISFFVLVLVSTGLGFNIYIYNLYSTQGIGAVKTWLIEDKGLSGMIFLAICLIFLYFMVSKHRHKIAEKYVKYEPIIYLILSFILLILELFAE